MKKILAVLSFLFILAFANISYAQVASGNPGVIQVTVSSGTQVLIFDGTRMDWTLHPAGGNIRCEPGFTNGQNSALTPTSSVGMEFVSNGYYTNYSTPTVSLVCTAESGSVVTDLWIDYKF
jgi:hypothetical protein